ncbi:MAG: amidohydrolase family protein [Chloroflexi bacterium]|nr:amidohydrolase family protein [Chloroflexota bacterium]MBV9595309.1 amidohydrolase family protein [Chloroflexota bacterium]
MPGPQVLRAARLFDGVSARLIQQPMVVIDAGRITGVESGPIESPTDAEVVDLGDVTLLPGMIDAHVHLGFDAGPRPVAQMLADSDATLLLRMRLAARRALAAGITTVRDLGDRNYLGVTLRDWFRSGAELGPEIIAAGPPVTVTGGHCHFMGGEADGELEVRRGVRTRVKSGVDVIKIMATGGHMTPGTNPSQPQYTVAELQAAVEEAHRLGRSVTAHAHGPAGIANAVAAGVDCIEHCSFRVGGGRQPDRRLIEGIAERRIAVSPTVGTAPSTRPGISTLAESFLPILEDMHQAGVRLIGGTDAGVSPGKPHDVLPYGVAFLARAGLTNVEALAAATSVGAEACGVGERKGAVKPGRDADLFAVVGDPTLDLGALLNVTAVFRAGRRVDVN